MIGFLSKWIEGIALTVIIASIFEMILPNGNLKRYIKIILGVYIIFSIISPFVDTKALYNIDLLDNVEKYSKNNEHNTQQTTPSQDLNKIYANTFENEIKRAIEIKGYTIYKCKVEGNFVGESKDVGIKKIEIILNSKKQIQESREDSSNTIKIDNIEKVEIGKEINDTNKKITESDIRSLKKYISEHYEVEQKIISIQSR